MSGRKFTAESISDQKRLARAEHLLLARRALRCRDNVHHGKWRVLILAGNAPEGEITAIREVMKNATIVAIDKDQSCVDAAIRAGADEAYLASLNVHEFNNNGAALLPHPALRRLAKFDYVHFDLCESVYSIGYKLRHNASILSDNAAYSVTFSYGRDVAEYYWRKTFQESSTYHGIPVGGGDAGIDVPLRGRIGCCIQSKAGWADTVLSVILYKGAEMPMCSVMFWHNHFDKTVIKPSIVRLQPGDFELAVTDDRIDNSRLYDCPEKRIKQLRLRHSALKAVYTRQTKKIDASDLLQGRAEQEDQGPREAPTASRARCVPDGSHQ